MSGVSAWSLLTESVDLGAGSPHFGQGKHAAAEDEGWAIAATLGTFALASLATGTEGEPAGFSFLRQVYVAQLDSDSWFYSLSPLGAVTTAMPDSSVVRVHVLVCAHVCQSWKSIASVPFGHSLHLIFLQQSLGWASQKVPGTLPTLPPLPQGCSASCYT